jgi:hypothetical protein
MIIAPRVADRALDDFNVHVVLNVQRREFNSVEDVETDWLWRRQVVPLRGLCGRSECKAGRLEARAAAAEVVGVGEGASGRAGSRCNFRQEPEGRVGKSGRWPLQTRCTSCLPACSRRSACSPALSPPNANTSRAHSLIRLSWHRGAPMAASGAKAVIANIRTYCHLVVAGPIR